MARAALPEGLYADDDRQKQDEAVSSERAEPRGPHSTTASHGGATFRLWTDFWLPSDIERWTPRFYLRGPVFCAFEVARGRLNTRLAAAKIRVCSVPNTEGADCLLAAKLFVPLVLEMGDSLPTLPGSIAGVGLAGQA